jgi:hypothetical protein
MASIVQLRNPWRAVAKASDRVAELVTDIPGWPGYDYPSETQAELESVAALLWRAVPLLERTRDREAGCDHVWHEVKAENAKLREAAKEVSHV